MKIDPTDRRLLFEVRRDASNVKGHDVSSLRERFGAQGYCCGRGNTYTFHARDIGPYCQIVVTHAANVLDALEPESILPGDGELVIFAATVGGETHEGYRVAYRLSVRDLSACARNRGSQPGSKP